MSISMFDEGVLLVGAQMPSGNPVTKFNDTKFNVTKFITKLMSRADILQRRIPFSRLRGF